MSLTTNIRNSRDISLTVYGFETEVKVSVEGFEPSYSGRDISLTVYGFETFVGQFIMESSGLLSRDISLTVYGFETLDVDCRIVSREIVLEVATYLLPFTVLKLEMYC